MVFRTKTIGAGVITVALAAAVVVFSYSIRSMAVDTDIVAQEVANIEVQAQEAQSITSMLEQSGDATEAIQDFFVPSTEVVRYIEIIEARARAAGVLITVDSVSDPRPKKDTEAAAVATTEALPFESSFTLSGSLSAIESFLKSLTYLPYHLQINELALSVRDGSSGWIGNLKLQAYMIDTQ